MYLLVRIMIINYSSEEKEERWIVNDINKQEFVSHIMKLILTRVWLIILVTTSKDTTPQIIILTDTKVRYSIHCLCGVG